MLRTAILCVLLPAACPAGAAGPVPDEASPARAEDDYRRHVRQIEIDHGPYDSRLAEPLLGWGTALTRRGDFDEAALLYRRALYLTRVNEGLYSLNQLPILDRVIETDAVRGDWDEVSRGYRYYYWLHRRHLDPGDPHLLAVIERLKAWHLAAINLNTPEGADHLNEVRDLSELALAIAERQSGRDDPRVAAYLYQCLLVHYYMAIAVQRAGSIGLQLASDQQPAAPMMAYPELSERLTARHYREGLDLLERIGAIYAGRDDSQPTAAAMVTLYTGDWHLLFNRDQHARRAYDRSYAEFLAAGIHAEQLDAYFHRPVVLPDERFLEQPDWTELPVEAAESAPEEDVVHIRNYIAWSHELPGLRLPIQALASEVPAPDSARASAAFHLEDNGWAEGIRIAEVHPRDRATRARAYETVWSIQFRPRLVGGRTKRTGSVAMDFILPDRL